MTARPRHREDVLAIARKLRLTSEERDRLLLATGFPPEIVEEVGSKPGGEQEDAEPEVSTSLSRQAATWNKWWPR